MLILNSIIKTIEIYFYLNRNYISSYIKLIIKRLNFIVKVLINFLKKFLRNNSRNYNIKNVKNNTILALKNTLKKLLKINNS